MENKISLTKHQVFVHENNKTLHIAQSSGSKNVRDTLGVIHSLKYCRDILHHVYTEEPGKLYDIKFYAFNNHAQLKILLISVHMRTAFEVVEVENLKGVVLTRVSSSFLPGLQDSIINCINSHMKSLLKQKEIEMYNINNPTNNEPNVELIETADDNTPDEPDTVESRYSKIIGNTKQLSRDINDGTMLSGTKELEELFNKAAGALEQYSKIQKEEPRGFFSKMFKGDNKEKLKTVSQNIDYLFGLIESKFDSLVRTGEKFQDLKLEMHEQYLALVEVLEASNAEMKAFEDSGKMVPMRMISTNSQIEASVEAVKSKLLKIEAGITLTTGAVIALGAKLPAMRAGVSDEMAFAGLLADVGNVHGMVSEAADLMLGIANNTSDTIYTKVEEIIDSQINDKTMLMYLESRKESTDKLAIMVSDKAQLLSDKLKEESGRIKQISIESKAGDSTLRLSNLNA